MSARLIVKEILDVLCDIALGLLCMAHWAVSVLYWTVICTGILLWKLLCAYYRFVVYACKRETWYGRTGKVVSPGFNATVSAACLVLGVVYVCT